MRRTADEREAERSMSAMLLEVIGPALIILMIGSLVFFLIEVFYRGPHTGRLCWVFGLFTFASVLVSRISIESGREKAVVYGLALGAAAFVVAFVLVEFTGALAIILEPLILLGFIAVVMWSASKLTWDCTVIDNSRDTSAMGITERVTRQLRGEEESTNTDQPANENETETSSDEQAGNWIKTLFNGQRRKNTPGIWVFYFAMAALPIFGIGQWFVAARENGYGWVVFLFGIYLASALALMMTTSLLSLHRYLQKRNTYMPAEISRNWIGMGTVIALAVLVLVMLIPRPNAQLGIANGLKWFTSPPLKSSDLGMGKDGTEEKSSGNSSKSSEEGKKSSADAKTKGTSGESKNAEKTKGGGKSKGNDKGSSKSKQKNQQKSQSKDGQKQSKQNQSQKDSDQKQNQSNDNQKSKGDQQSKSDQNQQNKKSDQKSEQSKQGEQNKQERRSSPNDRKRPDKLAEKAAQERREQEAKKEREKQNKEAEEKKENSGGSKSNKKNKQSKNNSNNSKSNPNNSFDTPNLSSISTFAKYVTYAIAFIFAAILAFVLRKEIVSIWKSILEAIRNFLNPKAKEKAQKRDTAKTMEAPQKQLPPFTAFNNPFASDAWKNSPPEKIVEYSFRALEAWARDGGYARPEDMTPNEFANQIAKKSTDIGGEARRLANLLSKSLFAKSRLGHAEVANLKKLWQLLQTTSPLKGRGELATA